MLYIIWKMKISPNGCWWMSGRASSSGRLSLWWLFRITDFFRWTWVDLDDPNAINWLIKWLVSLFLRTTLVYDSPWRSQSQRIISTSFRWLGVLLSTWNVEQSMGASCRMSQQCQMTWSPAGSSPWNLSSNFYPIPTPVLLKSISNAEGGRVGTNQECHFTDHICCSFEHVGAAEWRCNVMSNEYFVG